MISEAEPLTNTIPRSLAATVPETSGLELVGEEEREACAGASELRLRIKESTKSTWFLAILRYIIHSSRLLLDLAAHGEGIICSSASSSKQRCVFTRY